MITSITYDRVKNEIGALKTIIKDLAANHTDEQWCTEFFCELCVLLEMLSDKPLVDFMIYDVTESDDISELEKIRKEYPYTYLLLLADIGVSPMKYIRPTINAQSLLLRPFSQETATSAIKELLCEYLNAHFSSDSNSDKVFVVDSQEDGKVVIPFDKIYYFEALDKKIYVCTETDEYGFYGTLDKLTESLPDYFARCHRSYIVNRKKIVRVALSQNLISLCDGMEVPLSRSFKSDFKENR